LEAQDIAIKLYTELRNDGDRNLNLLRSLILLENVDMKKVLEIYEVLLNQEAFVAVVKTRTQINDKQRSEIEKKVEAAFKGDKLYFKFIVDKQIGNTLEVVVNDKVFKYSI